MVPARTKRRMLKDNPIANDNQNVEAAASSDEENFGMSEEETEQDY